MCRKPSSPELELCEYQRLIFGASDSPVCANFVLQQAAKKDFEYYPYWSGDHSADNLLEWHKWPRLSLQTRMSRTLWKKVNSIWQNGAAIVVSFVSRCKTIYTNQSKSSSLNVFLFYVKFLLSYWNHISIPHPSKDSTAGTVHTWTRMGQSYQWRQWKGHQGLGTGSRTIRHGRGKQVGGWTAHGETMVFLILCQEALEATAALSYI